MLVTLALLFVLVVVWGVFYRTYTHISLTYQERMLLWYRVSVLRQALSRLFDEAGFWGCLRPQDAPLDFEAGTSSPIPGAEGAWLAWSYAKDPPYLLKKPADPGLSLFLNRSPRILKKGHVLVLNDCQNTEFVEVSQTHERGSDIVLQLQAPLQYFWPSATEVRLKKNGIFYLKKTERKTSSGLPVVALYSELGEFLEGVEDWVWYFQLRDGLEWLPIESITRWSDVVSAKVEALVTTHENILQKPMVYVFNKKTIVAKDKRIYKVVHFNFNFLNH